MCKWEYTSGWVKVSTARTHVQTTHGCKLKKTCPHDELLLGSLVWQSNQSMPCPHRPFVVCQESIALGHVSTFQFLDVEWLTILVQAPVQSGCAQPCGQGPIIIGNLVVQDIISRLTGGNSLRNTNYNNSSST